MGKLMLALLGIEPENTIPEPDRSRMETARGIVLRMGQRRQELDDWREDYSRRTGRAA